MPAVDVLLDVLDARQAEVEALLIAEGIPPQKGACVDDGVVVTPVRLVRIAVLRAVVIDGVALAVLPPSLARCPGARGLVRAPFGVGLSLELAAR